MWILFAFGSALFAGLTAVLAKIGIRNTDSDVATAIRTVVVLLFSWLMAWITGGVEQLGAVTGRTWLFLTLSGMATGASWLCYFRALQLGDINKVPPVDKSSTVLTMLLAFLFLGEALTWLKGLAIVLIGGGAYLMIQRRAAAESGPAGGEGAAKARKSPLWLLYALGSAVFASLTAILGKIGIENVDSTLGTAIRTGVVLVLAWAIVFARGKQKTIPAMQRNQEIEQDLALRRQQGTGPDIAFGNRLDVGGDDVLQKVPGVRPGNRNQCAVCEMNCWHGWGALAFATLPT